MLAGSWWGSTPQPPPLPLLLLLSYPVTSPSFPCDMHLPSAAVSPSVGCVVAAAGTALQLLLLAWPRAASAAAIEALAALTQPWMAAAAAAAAFMASAALLTLPAAAAWAAALCSGTPGSVGPAAAYPVGAAAGADCKAKL
jgi:hypothetical protein